MIITCNGKKFKAKNKHKIQQAKDIVSSAMEKLLIEAEQKNDEELFLMILVETKGYTEIALEEFDRKLGLKGFKKYVDLEEIHE